VTSPTRPILLAVPLGHACLAACATSSSALPLSVYKPDADRRTKALDGAGYLIALAQLASVDSAGMGEFVLRGRYGALPLPVAQETRTEVMAEQSVLLADLFGGDVARATQILDRLDEEIAQVAKRMF
jgi:hypothetical protein